MNTALIRRIAHAYKQRMVRLAAETPSEPEPLPTPIAAVFEPEAPLNEAAIADILEATEPTPRPKLTAAQQKAIALLPLSIEEWNQQIHASTRKALIKNEYVSEQDGVVQSA